VPNPARYAQAAITTIGEGDNQVDVLLNGDRTHFDAYDLNKLLNSTDDPWMWDLDISSSNPTAKNGVFYFGGGDWVAAVDAASGTVLWDQYLDPGANYGPPAVATITNSETGEDEELVFLTFSNVMGYTYGLCALRALDGSEAWARTDIGSFAQCCVDEDEEVLYAHNMHNGQALEAYDASKGDFLCSAPLDHILNAPPTLGWANYYPPPDPNDPDDTLYPAVFVVTGGVDDEAGVYAFRRDNGNLLWSTTIPSDAWVAPYAVN